MNLVMVYQEMAEHISNSTDMSPVNERFFICSYKHPGWCFLGKLHNVVFYFNLYLHLKKIQGEMSV